MNTLNSVFIVYVNLGTLKSVQIPEWRCDLIHILALTLYFPQTYERLHGLVKGGAEEDGGGGKQPEQQPHVQDPRPPLEAAGGGGEEGLEENGGQTEERTRQGEDSSVFHYQLFSFRL